MKEFDALQSEEEEKKTRRGLGKKHKSVVAQLRGRREAAAPVIQEVAPSAGDALPGELRLELAPGR